MKVTLKKFELMLEGDLPAEVQTIYKWSSKKLVNWIDRSDPVGHRGRQLWVDIQKYNEWAEPRGLKLAKTEGRAEN